MAFAKKTWTDRVAEYISRRLLTYSNGSTELVTVTREEGTVSTEGDAFSAENMNELEQRISDEFDVVNNAVNNVATKALMNTYEAINSDTYFNNVLATGIYPVNLWLGSNGGNGIPPVLGGGQKMGTLIVINSFEGMVEYVQQIYINGATEFMYRTCHGGTWSSWYTLTQGLSFSLSGSTLTITKS